MKEEGGGEKEEEEGRRGGRESDMINLIRLRRIHRMDFKKSTYTRVHTQVTHAEIQGHVYAHTHGHSV